jgi:hypothetical protein
MVDLLGTAPFHCQEIANGQTNLIFQGQTSFGGGSRKKRKRIKVWEDMIRGTGVRSFSSLITPGKGQFRSREA